MICCSLIQSDDGSKESPFLDVSVKDIKDWEVLRNIQIFQVNGISAISSSIQFLSCSTTKTILETIDRDRQSTLVGTVNQRIDFDFYLLYRSTNFPPKRNFF